MESNCFLIQRKQKIPPPLTEEEIDQMLSTTALPTIEIAHKETIQQIIVYVEILPQKDTHPCEHSQKEERHHSSTQKKRKTPPLSTKEETNEILSI